MNFREVAKLFSGFAAKYRILMPGARAERLDPPVTEGAG